LSFHEAPGDFEMVYRGLVVALFLLWVKAYICATIEDGGTDYKGPIFEPLQHLQQFQLKGEVSEWSKEHAWKVCVLQKGTEGSNPSLSANQFIAWRSRAFLFDALPNKV
jgi:hypothetical protein